MNKKEVTILTLWNWEEITVEMTIESFLTMQNEDLNNWIKEFFISKLRRTITYSDIKWKIGKTLHFTLPEPSSPKKEFKELTPSEREKRDKMIAEVLEKTKEWRKKRFIEERTRILKDLEARELRFWLDTTISKLAEYTKLKQKEQLNKLNKNAI